MPNLTAELFSRVVEILSEVFGEGRVEATPRPDEYPPTVEFGNVWISPPDEGSTEYTYGTQHNDPGGPDTPPETDTEDKGSFAKMDDAIKAAVLCHAAEMVDEKFLSEGPQDGWDELCPECGAMIEPDVCGECGWENADA